MIYFYRKKTPEKLIIRIIYYNLKRFLVYTNILCKYLTYIIMLSMIIYVVLFKLSFFTTNNSYNKISNNFEYIQNYQIIHKKRKEVFQPEPISIVKTDKHTHKNILDNKQWNKLSKKQQLRIKENFVKKYWEHAHEVSKIYDVHPLLLLARSARESRYHTSEISILYNNLAGLKYKSRMIKLNPNIFKIKNQSKKYFDDDPNDTFFVFDNPKLSFNALGFWLAGKGTLYGGRVKKGTLKEWDMALCCKTCKYQYSTYCNIGDDYNVGIQILKIALDLKLKIYDYPDKNELLKKAK